MPATAQVRISADTSQFNQAMGDVQKKVGNIGNMASKQAGIISKAFGVLGKASLFTSGIIAPSAFVASERLFRKFEHNMMEVFTLLPKANEAMFKKMKDDALDFSESYGVLPEEVAKGMYQSISAGINTDELGGFMDIAQKSAVAGVTDLKTAVDALTNVVNAYGKGTYDVNDVADQMFHAVSMSKTTFRELADYMYQIIPTAASMKVRMDDLLGSISALAATGTLTRVGTTQLRQFLIELSRTGDKANEAFLQGTGGMPVQNFIKQGGRMVEIVKILGDVARAKGTDLRNLFSSVEAGNAALTLFNSRSYAGMVDSIEGSSAGAMSKAFEKMEGTLQYRFNKIMRTAMNVFIRLGDVIKPALDDIYEYFEEVAEKIKGIKWNEIEENFNVVWHKIKKSITDGSAWEIFKTYAKLAFKEIQLFIEDSLFPTITKITNKLTEAFDPDGDYKITDALMGALDGVINYLGVIAKRVDVFLMDGLKAPMAFLKSSMEEAAHHMVDVLVDLLPASVAKVLGLKGRVQRQKDESNDAFGNMIKNDAELTEKVNLAIFGEGKQSQDAMEDSADPYRKKIRLLEEEKQSIQDNPNLNRRRISPKQIEEKYQDYTNRLGFIQEHRMPIEVLREYRRDRGDTAQLKKDIDNKINDLNLSIESALNNKMSEDFNHIRSFEDQWDGLTREAIFDDMMGRTAKEQYGALTGGDIRGTGGDDLFEGIDFGELKSGRMGKDYEKIISRLNKLEEEVGTDRLGALAEFRDNLVKRRDMIFDTIFEMDLPDLDRITINNISMKEKYHSYLKQFQKNIDHIKSLSEESFNAEEESAIKQITANYELLQNNIDAINKKAEEYDSESAENIKKREKELKPLKDEVDGLVDKIKGMVKALGVPKPRPKAKDAINDGDLFEQDPTASADWEVRAKFAKVQVGKLQKMGMGGGFGNISQNDIMSEKLKERREKEEKEKKEKDKKNKDKEQVEARNKNTQALIDLTKALSGEGLEKSAMNELRDIGASVRNKLMKDKNVEFLDVTDDGFSKYNKIIKKSIDGQSLDTSEIVEALQIIQGIMSGNPEEISENNQENLAKAFNKLKAQYKEVKVQERDKSKEVITTDKKESNNNNKSEKVISRIARSAGREDAEKITSVGDEIFAKYEGVINSKDQLEELLRTAIQIDKKPKSMDSESNAVHNFNEVLEKEISQGSKDAIKAISSSKITETTKSIARDFLENIMNQDVDSSSPSMKEHTKKTWGKHMETLESDKYSSEEKSLAEEEIMNAVRAVTNELQSMSATNLTRQQNAHNIESISSLKNKMDSSLELQNNVRSEEEINDMKIQSNLKQDKDYKYSKKHWEDAYRSSSSSKEKLVATDLQTSSRIDESFNIIETEDKAKRAEELELGMMYSAMSAIDTMANPESSDESKDLAIRTLDALGANGSKWKDNNRIFDHEEKELLKAQVQRQAIFLSDLVRGGPEDYQRGGWTFSEDTVQKITDAMTEFNKHKLDSGDERSLLIKEKMSKDYYYKYSDEHFNDATKTLKPDVQENTRKTSSIGEEVTNKKSSIGEEVSNKITQSLTDVWLDKKEESRSTDSEENKFVTNRIKSFQENPEYNSRQNVDVDKGNSAKVQKDYLLGFVNAIMNQANLQVDRTLLNKIDRGLNVQPQQERFNSPNLDNAINRFEKAVEKMDNKMKIEHIEPINMIQ